MVKHKYGDIDMTSTVADLNITLIQPTARQQELR